MTIENETYGLVNIDEVMPNRYQPRKQFNEKELEELAESIDRQGLIQPITVRELPEDEDSKYRYELVAGERRWRATKMLGKKRIKAIIRELSEDQLREEALIENIQREDLNIMDEANAIVAFMDAADITQEQAAARLGKTRSYIASVVRLVKLPDKVQQYLFEGNIGKGHATILFALPTDELREHLADEIVNKGFGVEKAKIQANKLLKEHKKEQQDSETKSKKYKPQDRYLLLVQFDSEKTLKEHAAQLEKFGFHTWKGSEIKRDLKEWYSGEEQQPEPIAELPELPEQPSMLEMFTEPDESVDETEKEVKPRNSSKLKTSSRRRRAVVEDVEE